MTLQKGDWIFVPAGTKLEYATPSPFGAPLKTKRDVVVQITSVQRGRHGQLEQSLPEPLLSEYKQRQPTVPSASSDFEGYYRTCRELNEEFCQRAIAADPLWDLTVFWGSKSDKFCAARDVTLTDAPPAKPKKQPKINKRQQMVKGSKWKLTQDVVITFRIPNPKVAQHQAAWEAANPRPLNAGGTMREDMGWREIAIAHRKNLESKFGAEIDHKVRECKAGEVFTVADKFTTYNPYHILDKTAGAIAIIQFDGDTDCIHARYKQLEPIIEAESIPTVDVFALRQKSTGKFFKGTEYNEEKTKEAQRIKGTKWGVWYEHAVYDPIFVDNFMKAKHFDNVGRAKSSILEATGYYYELPGSENLPEWMGHPASFEFTEDYELVKFDKLARKEVETIDLWGWYEQAWRLRELTVVYGSSVRSCYKELEKKDLLGSQTGMIVFTASEDMQNSYNMHWGQRSALSQTDKDEINKAIAAAGFKKGSYKRGEDHKSIAISFPDKRTAMMFRLSYAGDLPVTVIDLDEMKEVVEAAA